LKRSLRIIDPRRGADVIADRQSDTETLLHPFGMYEGILGKPFHSMP
jgi:hypothetical protein